MRRSLFKLYFPWKGGRAAKRRSALGVPPRWGSAKTYQSHHNEVGAEMHESLKSVGNFWLITRLTQNLSGL